MGASSILLTKQAVSAISRLNRTSGLLGIGGGRSEWERICFLQRNLFMMLRIIRTGRGLAGGGLRVRTHQLL